MSSHTIIDEQSVIVFYKLQKLQGNCIYTFTLSPIHVSYANTLRRLILANVETIAFRSNMTSTGTTTDVLVKHNDTPMTNEMLADRVGLLPIHVTNPLEWNDDKLIFKLNVESNKDTITHIKCSNFEIINTDINDDEEEKKMIYNELYFPPHRITRDTCVIASLPASTTKTYIEIVAKATKGTGREHSRFCPVSQCSYEYTVDETPERINGLFQQWLTVSKKINQLDPRSERYQILLREFNTMQHKYCFKVNKKEEPYSFDFVIETVGVLSVDYIIKRACEIGEHMCSKYVNIHKGDIPHEITISASESKIIGFDFLFRGHDHTLGNLLQTWLVENHIEGNESPKITYAGYSVPHPLRDEMLLRIGVEDGLESTARFALQQSMIGCVMLFQNLKKAWGKVTQVPKSLVKKKVATSLQKSLKTIPEEKKE